MCNFAYLSFNWFVENKELSRMPAAEYGLGQIDPHYRRIWVERSKEVPCPRPFQVHTADERAERAGGAEKEEYSQGPDEENNE